MQDDRLLKADTHFEFGKNWEDYSRLIDEEAIAEAERGILALVPQNAIKGASWLDIGSGSGLHSLAAARLGASAITALDIDKDSVATTKKVLDARGVDATVLERSVFEIDDLGQFDVVYSWGVLHHTGAMWRAVRSAAERVRPGGLLVIALYQKTPLCGPWTVEKRIYTAASEPVRSVMRKIYKSLYKVGLLVTGRTPGAYERNYKSSRGMNWDHDIHDWLGGYPYESSTPQETKDFVVKLGFEPIKIGDLKPGMGVFGTMCAEYVFRRNAA